MIHRLDIRNWRAYRKAEIDLGRPVVFFVAPNGVGKTSLYEAARSCMLGFPARREAGRAVRADADDAQISMQLTVDDSLVTVSRTLTRTGRATFSAFRDDTPIEEDEFLQLIEGSWAADPALLDRLIFGDLTPSSRSTATLPIREHLADLLGVTPMLEAASALRDAQTSARRAVEGLRTEVATSDEAIQTAREAVDAAVEDVEATKAERDALTPRLRTAERAATIAAAWQAYRAEVDAHNEQINQLVENLRELITVDPADPAAALDEARDAVEQDLDSARTSIAEADRAAAKAASATDLLAESVDVCPTCLRPLTDAERLDALHAHVDVRTNATEETEQAAEAVARSEERLRTLQAFTRQLDQLQPPRPPDEDDPGRAAVETLAELRALDTQLAERSGEARARHETATRDLEAALADASDAARLKQAAREELLLETTANVLDGVAHRYLSERIEPLTREVAHRWKLLFGTEGLTLEPSGEIRLRRGAMDLSFDDMSGGEQAVAGIIVRLLVTAAATRIPTVWFDEPLEHLDPRRRAGVAQTLVKAVAAGTVEQVVVTTYEERIARRLQLTAPDLVAVSYADTDHGSTDPTR